MLLPDSAAALASESFRTAVEYHIPLDSPQMSASSDTRAFSGWAAEFHRQLTAHRWTSPAFFTRELASCLHGLRNALQLPQQVFVFVPEITPERRSFLDALATAGVQVTFSPEFAPEHEQGAPNTTLARYEFDGVADELRAAAQWARQQVEASPDVRVGVILFDLDRRLPQVQSAFRSILHPEHLLGGNDVASDTTQDTAPHSAPSAFEIASPIALADYPVVRCALQLLSLFAAPIEFSAFQSALRSPYLAEAPEAVDRFLARIRKNARRQVSSEDLATWLRETLRETSRESSRGTNDVPRLRAALDALPKHSAFSSMQAPAYWADISRRILQAFGWPAGVPLNSEEYQCTQSWRELLTSVSSLELLDWRTDFRGFVARLERAAAAQNFKPETLNAPVQIMDATESEGSVFDALWIGSCSDDLWPDSPKISPLIPIALLKEAGVALVGTPQADLRLSRITSRLLQSAPQICLSLARRTDDEREQRWSPAFVGTCAPFTIPGEAIEMPPLLAERFESANLQVISDSAAPALESTEVARGGTSLLQEQSNCPFRAFAIRRLFARQDQGPNEALAPTDRGKIIELALQLIWDQLKDSEGLHRADRASVVENAVKQAMADVLSNDAFSNDVLSSNEVSPSSTDLSNNDPSNDAQWTARFHALECQRTIDVITEWLALESTRKPFHVVGHQLPVELNLSGLRLHGRIDRLDEICDAHVVIDYKTGISNSVGAWQVPRPQMPQLPFYALAMLQQKFNLAGVSFAVVRKGESGFKAYLSDKDLLPCPNTAEHIFGLAFDEYTGRWAAELESIASAFVRGHAAVDPKIPPGKSGSSCDHCHLASLCRVGDRPDYASNPESSNSEAQGEPDE
jgi:probable DNA repair protein